MTQGVWIPTFAGTTPSVRQDIKEYNLRLKNVK